MEINLLCCKTIFVCFKTTLCLAIAIPHPLESIQCFLGALTNFKTQITPLDFQNLSWASHFLKGGKLSQTKYISFSLALLSFNTN
jgi:hypothetical protein